MRAILETGADVHARFGGGVTALYLAAKGGHQDVVRDPPYPCAPHHTTTTHFPALTFLIDRGEVITTFIRVLAPQVLVHLCEAIATVPKMLSAMGGASDSPKGMLSVVLISTWRSSLPVTDTSAVHCLTSTITPAPPAAVSLPHAFL